MDNRIVSYPPNTQVKILSARTEAGLEARINYWLANEGKSKQVLSINVSPRGIRLHALIAYINNSGGTSLADG